MADNGDDLGTILGVWAHPDDETWLSAGLMARGVQQGRRVVCVTATKGEAGFPDGDARTIEQRSAIRVAELEASLAALDVTEHHWLGYPDGGCAAVPDEVAVAWVARYLAEVQPDTVLTFGPDGGTGHGDHISVCRWSTLAVETMPGRRPRLLYATKTDDWYERYSAGFDSSSVMMFEGFQPERVPHEALAVYLDCDDPMVDRKLAALRAQASQIEPLVQVIGVGPFRELIREEYFREPLPEDPDTLASTTAFSRARLG